MKIQHLRPALSYAVSRTKPALDDVIQKRKDAALALYILDVIKPDMDAFQLGIALAYATENAARENEVWQTVMQKIVAYPKAGDIWTGMVASCLISAARAQNINASRILLSLPQVPQIEPHHWDGVLMEALPKGHPEKRRIEKRQFEDRDGHPEILKMVQAAMAKPASPSPRKAQPAI